MSLSADSLRDTRPSVRGCAGVGKEGIGSATYCLCGVSDIEYTIRRSPRARRTRVNIDPQRGIEVVLPQRAPQREAAAAVVELRPWIERRLRELERVRETVAARAGTLPYLGQTLTVVTEPGRTRAHRAGLRLLVPAGPERLPALERFYRRAARREIAARLDRACALAG